ncbi:hypothetical protein ACE10Z_36330 [Bradyrhizobium sp. Pha-3]|uniref:hypothetical protein n=1 Tax=Bradyrhizobium sp. Pha-3 TaxID=208375 RepID=UPI0035D43C4D
MIAVTSMLLGEFPIGRSAKPAQGDVSLPDQPDSHLGGIKTVNCAKSCPFLTSFRRNVSLNEGRNFCFLVNCREKGRDTKPFVHQLGYTCSVSDTGADTLGGRTPQARRRPFFKKNQKPSAF